MQFKLTLSPYLYIDGKESRILPSERRGRRSAGSRIDITNICSMCGPHKYPTRTDIGNWGAFFDSRLKFGDPEMLIFFVLIFKDRQTDEQILNLIPQDNYTGEE